MTTDPARTVRVSDDLWSAASAAAAAAGDSVSAVVRRALEDYTAAARIDSNALFLRASATLRRAPAIVAGTATGSAQDFAVGYLLSDVASRAPLALAAALDSLERWAPCGGDGS